MDILHRPNGYFDELFTQPAEVLSYAVAELTGKDFDTIVGSGLSGTVAATLIAHQMGKNLVVVRKATENSHSSNLIEGKLGKRWIFIDDFIASGATLSRCKDAVRATALGYAFDTQYVGAYLYARRSNTYAPAWED